jgi:hypothetical protein
MVSLKKVQNPKRTYGILDGCGERNVMNRLDASLRSGETNNKPWCALEWGGSGKASQSEDEKSGDHSESIGRSKVALKDWGSLVVAHCSDGRLLCGTRILTRRVLPLGYLFSRTNLQSPCVLRFF